MKQERDFNRLIQRAKDGNQQACTELYESTSQAVYRTVHAMVRSEELARDIQQDTYVQAFTHLDQLGDPEKLLPWLRAIAVNQARTAMRKQQPILFSELSDEGDTPDPEPVDESVEGSPELALDRKETSALVRELLGGLTDAQRMLVGMYYYEQIPVKQIAEDLGVSEGAVKTQLMRSRKKVEEGVRQLEQRGIKLFGLAPLPFLLHLLKREELGAETGRQVLSGALAEAGKAAAPATLHVGRRFVETAGGKVLLGLLTVGVIGAGVAGYGWAKKNLNAPMGDVRPTAPTDSVVMEYHDSQEDLPTFPVTTEPEIPEPVTETGWDSSEDLPITSEPTEPRPTDPQPTEPRPTEPQPTEPRPTEPQPTEPRPTDPQPTEPQPTAPAEASLSAFYWETTGTASISDVPWYLPLRVCAKVKGSTVPVLSTDDSTLFQITSQESLNYTDYETGEACYFWTIAATGSGTGHVYCSINGEKKGTLVLSNPGYEEKIVGWKWDYTDTSSGYSCDTGKTVCLLIWTQGKTVPSIQTDAADVIEIMATGPFEGDGVTWLVNGQGWKIRAIGPGTATIYCMLNGQTVETLTITVNDPKA